MESQNLVPLLNKSASSFSKYAWVYCPHSSGLVLAYQALPEHDDRPYISDIVPCPRQRAMRRCKDQMGCQHEVQIGFHRQHLFPEIKARCAEFIELWYTILWPNGAA
jgi:hypothetical protein